MFNLPKRRVLASAIIFAAVFAACTAETAPVATTEAMDMESDEIDMTDEAMTDEAMDDDHGDFAFGEAADAADADRVIEIETLDTLKFDPDSLEISVGETITFRVTNPGNLPHDFTLADSAGQDEHEEEMAEMIASGGMAMDDPNAFAIEPGETKELTWHFEEAGTVLIGCHQTGHYAAGMIATITVSG